MAEVVGELGAPEGAVPIPISEPDVCRALTGVAEEALPERGELRSAGSLWAWWWGRAALVNEIGRAHV